MKKTLFLVGPTAVGKTEWSLKLAAALNGEIISADSMQVYQGMDVGTAKPSANDLKTIPHYLISDIPPTQEFSAFDFRERALRALEEIHAKGKLALVVGGSGLYLKVLLDGLQAHPGKDERLRAQLEAEVVQEGLERLYARLRLQNAAVAARIKPQDKRRIIRALEVASQEGQPQQKGKSALSLEKLGYDVCVVGLMRERAELYKRVESRVDEMLAAGLLQEVKILMGQNLAATAAQAVGYKELFAYLSGEYDWDRAVTLIKQNSRHLVKKQLTWFRKDSRIQWFFLDRRSENDIYQEIISSLKDWL